MRDDPRLTLAIRRNSEPVLVLADSLFISEGA